MRKAISVFALLLLALCGSVEAQTPEPSMYIGPVMVRIGMPQDELTKSLKRHYDLFPVEGLGAFLVGTRQNTEGDAPEIIGSVTFKNGKLTDASRDWQGSVGSAWELTDLLNTILTQMKDRGERVALITTTTTKQPQRNFQTIKIAFSNREVVILATEMGGHKNVTISEVICSTHQCLPR